MLGAVGLPFGCPVPERGDDAPILVRDADFRFVVFKTPAAAAFVMLFLARLRTGRIDAVDLFQVVDVVKIITEFKF